MLKIENACAWLHILSCWLTDQIHGAYVSWLYCGNCFDFCCFKATTLSPLHLVVNWQVIPTCVIMYHKFVWNTPSLNLSLWNLITHQPSSIIGLPRRLELTPPLSTHAVSTPAISTIPLQHLRISTANFLLCLLFPFIIVTVLKTCSVVWFATAGAVLRGNAVREVTAS